MFGRSVLALLFGSLLLIAPSRSEAQAAPPEPAPVLVSPTARPARTEPTIEELEAELLPTLVLPEFRLRAAGGVSFQTAGADAIWGRISEEFEWQPSSLEFLLFGVGASQMLGSGGVIYQFGARVGGHAWFCEDTVVRCQGAITLQLGYVGGAAGSAFDFSADADLRFLFDKTLELFARGGFFAVGPNSFASATAGVGVAF